jgi:hypothetical protein
MCLHEAAVQFHQQNPDRDPAFDTIEVYHARTAHIKPKCLKPQARDEEVVM